MSLFVVCVPHVYLSLIFPFSLSPLCVVFFSIFLAIQLLYVPPVPSYTKFTDEGQLSQIFVRFEYLSKASTRCSLIRGGSFQGVLHRFVGCRFMGHRFMGR
jgi:hypothetical protein